MTGNSIKIAIGAIAAIAVAVVMYTGFSPSVPQQAAVAQSGEDALPDQDRRRSVTYLSTQTVLVPTKGDADAEAFCRDRDVVLSGGYTIGVHNSQELLPLTENVATLYSNTPLRIMNGTTILEGWHAGLVNSGTMNLTITANAICLDLN
jgi:hypothetical protein